MNASTQDILSRRRTPALDVAVVGGGMVGAAAALALARAGFSTALLEARAPAAWDADAEVDLRVVGLAPSSIALLDDLGVWTSIREARAGPYSHMHVWDAESGATIDFDAAGEGRARLGYIVENNLVQWMLWQALEAAGVRRMCPVAVQGFEAREDRIQLELADGGTLAAGVLVAADGAASPLRQLAGIGTRGRDYAQRAVVAHVATERPHEDTAWQRFLPGGPLALLPLADGRSSVVWSLPEAEARRVLALDEQGFRDELGVASDFRLGRIVATTPRAAFPLKLQLAERYQADRFVLLGDAAHTVHPLAGQGVNLGFQDAARLAAVLAGARDCGEWLTLRRYERTRKEAVRTMQLTCDALFQLFHAKQAPGLAWLRNAGLNLTNRLHLIKKQLARHAVGF